MASFTTRIKSLFSSSSSKRKNGSVPVIVTRTDKHVVTVIQLPGFTPTKRINKSKTRVRYERESEERQYITALQTIAALPIVIF